MTQQHYGNFLSGLQWQVYACGTYRASLSEDAVKAKFKFFLDQVEDRIGRVACVSVLERRTPGLGMSPTPLHWHFVLAGPLIPDEFYRLDVRWLQRHGILVPGSTRQINPRRDGGNRAQLWTRYQPGCLTADLDLGRDLFGERRKRFKISIRRTSCHYGASRPWFLCPRETCRRRVSILYGKEDFLCRRCRGVSYPIQRVAPASRLLARAQMVRVKMGGTGDMTVPFPPRPKGMHEWTYTRLALRAFAAESRLACNFLEEFGKPKNSTGTGSAESETAVELAGTRSAEANPGNSHFAFDLEVTADNSGKTAA